MTNRPALTREQLDEFEDCGVLRFERLISAERIERARDYVCGRLARVGLWRDGAWRLDERAKPRWPDSGVQASKTIGNRHPDVEAIIGEPALNAIVDQLLDARALDREIFKRPQILFTLPNADAWMMPTGWHVDVPRLASGRRPGVQLFTFLDTVTHGGGGTMIAAGSHRLLNEGRVIRAKALRSLLLREDYFRALYGGASDRERVRLLGERVTVSGVPLQVIELTGAPGDAYLMDLRVLHAVAPNAAAHPRMMATHRFVCADAVVELGGAYGWDDA